MTFKYLNPMLIFEKKMLSNKSNEFPYHILHRKFAHATFYLFNGFSVNNSR